VFELAFRPDRSSDVPLARQLADHLGDLIQTGRLAPDVRLPATREAATAIGVARRTVAVAYEMLTTRGLVSAHVGRGTFVTPRPRPGIAPVGAAPARLPRTFAWAGLFARATTAPLPAAMRQSAGIGPVPFDFRGGRVDPSTLPAEDLRWAFARPFQVRARLRALAAHHDPHGWPPLRAEVARHLTARGIACDPVDVAIVNGLQQAIDLAARLLVEPGDAVVLEQPGYFGAALAFAGRGADILGVEVDGDGLDTERLARILRLRRVKLVYVTPATQCPTGVALSPARRDALLTLADEHQVPIFEDDYDNELRYAGPALPALKATDRAGQILYAGTFSKILFPGLRLGYVVAARPLLERLVTARAIADFGSGVVEQAALATLLATRGLERHLRRVRKLYAERLATLLVALADAMPEGTRWTTPHSGHLVWVTLPPGIDPDRLQHAAVARGIAYGRGEAFFHRGDRGGEHLALSFAALEPDVIREGTARLAAVVREHMPKRGRAIVARPGRGRPRDSTSRQQKRKADATL
jgi:GntR family transcriptional regulator/MocR family aminotransferase